MILAPPQSPDLQAQFQEAMQGVLRRPGKGRRKGQWVLGQGEFSGLSEDEVYGRLRARQGGNTGSGPGGGLRSGGLGTPSGIDYVKRGMPVNGSITPDPVQAKTAPPPVKPNPPASDIPPVLSRKIGSTDAENPAENKAEGGVEEVGPPESAAPVTPNSLTAFGSSFKNARSSKGMSVRANDPLSPTPVPPVLQKPTPIKAAGPQMVPPTVTAAPPVLQRPTPQPFVPDAKVQLAQTMEDVKNMQSKDRSDAVSAKAKAEIANQVNPTNSKDPNRFDNDPAFQEWQKTDPDAIANRDRAAGARASLEGFVNRGDAMKESAAKNMETNAVGADRGFQEALVDKGMRFDPAASIQTGKERAAGLRSSMTHPLPPPVLQKPASSPIKAAGANQIAPAVAPTAALMNGEAQKPNPFAKKPLDNRLTAGLASNKRDKFSNKNPFV